MITEEEEPKEEFAATGTEFGANPDVYVIPEEAFPEDKEPVITEEEARKLYHSVPPGTDAVVDRQMAGISSSKDSNRTPRTTSTSPNFTLSQNTTGTTSTNLSSRGSSRPPSRRMTTSSAS